MLLHKAALFINRKTRGQSVLELLIAMGIFVMVSSAGILLFFSGQSLSVDGANARIGLDYAAEGLEATRSIRNRSWAEITTGEHGLTYVNGQWQFSAAQDAKDIFTRKVTVTQVATDTKNIVTTISWATDPSRPQTVQLTEQLTDWKNTLSGGCSSETLSGNWANPQVLGSADIGSGNSGTDVAVKLPYVFVSSTASTASKPDLFVFDVNNPAAPNLVKSIDIGSGGINSIFIKGNYLYAASPNDTKEFLLFDISNPVNTVLASSLDLSGSADAIGVNAFSNTAVIGRKSGAANTIVFINVTNPTSPSIISQVNTAGNVYDFYATDRRLYLVSQESDEDIWIYDITNPANPTFLTNYDIPGTTEDVSIYIQEKGGTTILDGNVQNELIAIGATNTAQMYIRNRISLGGDVNDINCVQGNLAFLATTNSTKEFTIVNVNDPDNLSVYASLNFPQNATGVDFADNKAFLSVRSNDSLRIVGPGP